MKIIYQDIGNTLRFHCRVSPCLRRAFKGNAVLWERCGMRGRFGDSLAAARGYLVFLICRTE